MNKTVLTVSLTAVLTGILVIGTAVPAQAAIDTSVQSTGQYLTGSLLNSLVVAATPQAFASHAFGDGSALDEPTSDLEALTLQVLELAGNSVGLPTDFSRVGVLRVHAEANSDGSGLGSAGLLDVDGRIQKPAPHSVTGTTLYDLSQAVSAAGLPGTPELGGLFLSLGATSSSASRSAADVIARDYDIASGGLVFRSPTLSGLSASLNDRVAALQATLDDFTGTTGPIASGLNELTSPAMSSDVTVTGADLAAAADSVPHGVLSDAGHPGVSIDLANGEVTIDLAAIVTRNGLPLVNGLNDLPANTKLITPELLQSINDSIAALVGDYGNRVTAALTAVINPLVIHATASPNNPQLDLTQTIAQTIIGIPIAPALAPSSVTGAALAQALSTAISGLTGGLGALTSTLLAPATATTFPAISTVLASVLQLTVNVQSDLSEGVSYATGEVAVPSAVYREAALRIDLLPALFTTPVNALVLTIASSSIATPGGYGAGGSSAEPDPTLANTGGDTALWFLPVAIAVLLIGFALIEVRRRPRARH